MSDLQEYQKLSLSQSSGQKGKPEPSEGQNCHGRRAIPLAQASNRLIAREGHCKCMEKPGAQPPTNSGSPHRSSEKTHRPAARQWAPCLNLYQPKGKVFLFLPSDFQEYQKESLSQVAGKTDAEKEPPPGSNFNRWTDQHLQGKAIANTGSFRRDQPPTFLPTSAKRSALSKRRISPPPEKGTHYIIQKCHWDWKRFIFHVNRNKTEMIRPQSWLWRQKLNEKNLRVESTTGNNLNSHPDSLKQRARVTGTFRYSTDIV